MVSTRGRDGSERSAGRVSLVGKVAGSVLIAEVARLCGRPLKEEGREIS